MKKTLSFILAFCLLAALAVPLAVFTASADTDGDWTYTVSNGKATITKYTGSASSVTIPSTLGGYPVTSIGERAFFNCTKLTSITIPDSVTSIGSVAFSGCTSLTSITIPDSVTNIGVSAFRGCTNLTSITIPDSVTSIGDQAFNNTAWYNDQPNGLVYAGKVAYKYKGTMTANTQIILREDSKGIAGYAFSNCTSLTSITIPDSVTSIGDWAFYNCTSLSAITIPDSVTSIEGSAFWGCTNLSSITIGDGVTNIGGSAFRDCTSLTSITIPDGVTSIGWSAFWGCTNLSSITIGDGVTSIGEYAFYNCKNLSSIMIPNSVTSIGEAAFYNCTSLTSITIPESVTSIGSSAFSGCYSLTEMTLPFVGDSRHEPSDKYQYPFGYIFGTSSYTGSAATTQDYYGNSTGYTISATYYIPTSLQTVTITGGNIPYGAFYNCKGLILISLGDSVTSIGDSAFYNCTSLRNVYFYGSPLFDSYNVFLNSKITLHGYTGSSVESYANRNLMTFVPLEDEGVIGDVDESGSIGDCDGNGVIDIGDVMTLAKYVAGWDVTLGPEA